MHQRADVNRFPGYDVLGQRDHWDSQTRRVVQDRLVVERAPRFFSDEEEPACRALLARLTGADVESGVPVYEMVDRRLAGGATDGWRYDDMPPDAEGWRRSLGELVRSGFADQTKTAQLTILESIRTGVRFAGMPAARLWGLWMRYACTAFYSHPAAWSEIGFGGPAYPRGYKNMGLDRREPWEVEDATPGRVPWARNLESPGRGDVTRRQAG